MHRQVGIALDATVAVDDAAIGCAVLAGLALAGGIPTDRTGAVTGLIQAPCTVGPSPRATTDAPCGTGGGG